VPCNKSNDFRLVCILTRLDQDQDQNEISSIIMWQQDSFYSFDDTPAGTNTTSSAMYSTLRGLGGGGTDGSSSSSSFGVHIAYEDLWYAIVYLAAIWTFGFLSEKLLFMPSLVGQIFAGIICGPELLKIISAPYDQAFVLLGEIGLVMLVIEAGVDIDVLTLKLIGKRGVIIAVIGSILPIAIGLGVAFMLGADTTAAIAAGASFGPTSLGIAMNILRSGKIINTPTGQLIVAAAIIDDMIALIILSQLGGLVGEITAASVAIPIVSALVFLIIGGYAALFIIPDLLERFVFKSPKITSEMRGKIGLTILFVLVIGMMQATHYTKASHLMGAFIAGLVFCTDHDMHVMFASQFKRVLQWLMRIFFASTIGFQVPIQEFGNVEVLWKGIVFTLALLGKVAVGFLVPNFTQSRNFTGNHLRDCLIVGCSMAAEGEFAFVIAAFAVDSGIIDTKLYSSVVLAILLSTIIAPFFLRLTINHFNNQAKREVKAAEDIVKEQGDIDEELKAGILQGSTVFFCVNTTSHAGWGTLPKLMRTLFDLNLEVIDHRSWHSRFEDTVVNEAYVKGDLKAGTDIEEQMHLIFNKIQEAINQKDAVISVSRWMPGLIDDLNHHENDIEEFSDKLVEEARKKLEKRANMAEMKDDLRMYPATTLQPKDTIPSISENGENENVPARRPPRRRVRIVSTPVGHGNEMFGEVVPTPGVFQPSAPLRPRRRQRTISTPLSGSMFGDQAAVVLGPGEILVHVVEPDGNKIPFKIQDALLKKMKETNIPLSLIEAAKETSFEGNYLDGFVRKDGKSRTLSSLSGMND